MIDPNRKTGGVQRVETNEVESGVDEKRGPIAPNGPSSTAADRARLLGPAPKPTGSVVAAAMMLRQVRPERFEVTNALGPTITAPLAAAIDGLPEGPRRMEAERSLALLSQHRIGKVHAVAILNGRNPRKVSDDDIANFTKPAIGNAQILDRLIRFARSQDAVEALHGTQPSAPVKQALLDHDDPAEFALAIDWLRAARAAGEPRLTRNLLMQHGHLDDDWVKQRTFADPAAVVSLLAERAAAGVEQNVAPTEIYDDPEGVEAVVDGVLARVPDHGNSLAAYRGSIGEALRAMALEGETIAAGAELLRVPSGLEQARSMKEAVAWAEDNGWTGSDMYRWTENGESRFGILCAELDVVFFDDGQPTRLESVKSGVGWHDHAAEHNDHVVALLADPEIRVIVPSGTEKRDVTAGIDKSNLSIETVTVGPPDDPSYDIALPLTSMDIARMAERFVD